MLSHIKLPIAKTYAEYDALDRNDNIFKLAAQEIVVYHHLPQESLTLLGGTNIVFAYGDTRILKLFPPAHQDQFDHEVLVLRHLQKRLSVQTPNVEVEGTISGWAYFIMNRLPGTLLEKLWDGMDHANKVIIMKELGKLIREVHAVPVQGLEKIDCHWDTFIVEQIKQSLDHHQKNGLPKELVQQIPAYLDSARSKLPKMPKAVLLTGEYTPMNILVTQHEGLWHISGLIDFGDAMLGLAQYDLLGPGAFLMQGDKELLREFLLAYGYTADELNENLATQLTTLMLLHRYSNLNVQIKIDGWQQRVKNLNDIEQLVWGFYGVDKVYGSLNRPCK